MDCLKVQWVATFFLADMQVRCLNFFAKSGWHCHPLEGTAGTPGALYISTPFLLSDRKPLDFYVQEDNNEVTIYDDGATMFALSSLGFDFTDRRNWRSLAGLAEKYAFELSEGGEFSCKKPEGEFMELAANAIALFAAVRTWEKERSAEGDMDFSLTKEVEEVLLRNAPDRKLKAGATVSVGTAEVAFDFQWGDFYVDTLRPVAISVNSRLRKGLLMRRVDASNSVLFVIDDTHSSLKANAEMMVLSSVAPTVKLSTLRELKEPYRAPLSIEF